MIENRKLTTNEEQWLEKMLSIDFEYREELIKQINCAEILRENTNYYINLIFQKIQVGKKIPLISGAPIEMRAYPDGQVPIQFFLFVSEGIVSELEVFNADLSEINNDMELENIKIEILIDSVLK